MNPVFPLNDVALRRVSMTRRVANPLYADDFWQISQEEFAMQVPGVGDFYACRGSEVEYAPAPDAALASVEVYLNGSVYGAILHQRHILPIHGSSFVWNGKGIMLCGDSGAGKSSLTASFCKEGAQFLTDDVTPLIFIEEQPFIIPLSDRIKLWDDSLEQMGHDTQELHRILPGHPKFYFPMKKAVNQRFPLHAIFVIKPEELDAAEINPLNGAELFAALRNEVYRWEYLTAMGETEADYFSKLVSLSAFAMVYVLKRPKNIPIQEMTRFLASFMNQL